MPDTTFYYDQQSNNAISSANHQLSLRLASDGDTMQTFVVMAKLRRTNGQNFNEDVFSTLGDGKSPMNSGVTRRSGVNQALAFSLSLFYDKRFKRPGHIFRGDLNIYLVSSKQAGYLKSENLFVQRNGEIDTDTINQQNESNESHRRVHGRLVYLGPLPRGYSLGLVYLFTHDDAATGGFAYDYNTTKGTYDNLNHSLSNQFKNISNVHWLYMQINAVKNRHYIDIGLNLQLNEMSNYNVSQSIKQRRFRFNVIPQASWDYGLFEGKYIGFSYR